MVHCICLDRINPEKRKYIATFIHCRMLWGSIFNSLGFRPLTREWRRAFSFDELEYYAWNCAILDCILVYLLVFTPVSLHDRCRYMADIPKCFSFVSQNAWYPGMSATSRPRSRGQYAGHCLVLSPILHEILIGRGLESAMSDCSIQNECDDSENELCEMMVS